MSSASRSQTRNAIQPRESPATAVRIGKPALIGLITVLSMVLFIPVLVLVSAAILVALLWPLFLAAFLEYGYVPGDPYSRNATPLAGGWYVLTFAWLAMLVAAPVVRSRLQRPIRLGRMDVDAIRKPRPRT